MSTDEGSAGGRRTTADARQAKLAAALRANLGRRKTQSRDRKAGAGGAPDEGAAEGPSDTGTVENDKEQGA